MIARKLMGFGAINVNWDAINNTLTDVNSAVSTGANIYNTVNKTVSSPTSPTQSANNYLPVQQSTQQVVNPLSQSKGLSTGAKVAIGVAGAGVLGTVIYLVTKKKKKA